MLDIEIRNFQSIDHVHVRIEGFTSLVGRSNLGKSAIVRAVKAALTGAAEDNFVRHGPTCEREVKGTKSCKCFCTVHLKTEGLDLLWEKGGDKNEYLINGEKKTAVGKGTPEFLEQMFGLVEIGDRKVLLQVADQFRSQGGGPIFLLDEYGSVVADVLSDVAQLDRINVASRMAEKDRREAVAQRKVREKDVMALKIKATSYDGLDDVLTRVRDIEAGERKIAEQRVRRDNIARLKEALIVGGKQFKLLRDLATTVIPEREPIDAQHAKAKALAKFLVSSTTLSGAVDRLAGVDIITVPAVERVQAPWKRLLQTAGWMGKLRHYKEFFAHWKALEGVPTPSADDLQTSAKKTLSLASLQARHTLLESQVSRLEGQLAQAEEEYQAVKKDEADLGACPTCAQPVTMTHDHAAE